MHKLPDARCKLQDASSKQQAASYKRQAASNYGVTYMAKLMYQAHMNHVQ